jgi:hypothetical protein
LLEVILLKEANFPSLNFDEKFQPHFDEMIAKTVQKILNNLRVFAIFCLVSVCILNSTSFYRENCYASSAGFVRHERGGGGGMLHLL